MRGRQPTANPTGPHLTHGRNDSGVASPDYAVFQITGTLAGRPIHTLTRSTISGISRFAVARHAIANNAVGRIKQTGQAVVNVELKGGEAIAVGDRVGVRKDSFYAQKDWLGPMIVEEVLGAVHPLHTCRVTLTGDRGDHKICDCNATAKDGPYQTIVWGSDFTVSEVSPGVTRVELA